MATSAGDKANVQAISVNSNDMHSHLRQLLAKPVANVNFVTPDISPHLPAETFHNVNINNIYIANPKPQPNSMLLSTLTTQTVPTVSSYSQHVKPMMLSANLASASITHSVPASTNVVHQQRVNVNGTTRVMAIPSALSNGYSVSVAPSEASPGGHHLIAGPLPPYPTTATLEKGVMSVAPFLTFPAGHHLVAGPLPPYPTGTVRRNCDMMGDLAVLMPPSAAANTSLPCPPPYPNSTRAIIENSMVNVAPSMTASGCRHLVVPPPPPYPSVPLSSCDTMNDIEFIRPPLAAVKTTMPAPQPYPTSAPFRNCAIQQSETSSYPQEVVQQIPSMANKCTVEQSKLLALLKNEMDDCQAEELTVEVDPTGYFDNSDVESLEKPLPKYEASQPDSAACQPTEELYRFLHHGHEIAIKSDVHALNQPARFSSVPTAAGVQPRGMEPMYLVLEPSANHGGFANCVPSAQVLHGKIAIPRMGRSPTGDSVERAKKAAARKSALLDAEIEIPKMVSRLAKKMKIGTFESPTSRRKQNFDSVRSEATHVSRIEIPWKLQVSPVRQYGRQNWTTPGNISDSKPKADNRETKVCRQEEVAGVSFNSPIHNYCKQVHSTQNEIMVLKPRGTVSRKVMLRKCSVALKRLHPSHLMGASVNLRNLSESDLFKAARGSSRPKKRSRNKRERRKATVSKKVENSLLPKESNLSQKEEREPRGVAAAAKVLVSRLKEQGENLKESTKAPISMEVQNSLLPKDSNLSQEEERETLVIAAVNNSAKIETPKKESQISTAPSPCHVQLKSCDGVKRNSNDVTIHNLKKQLRVRLEILNNLPNV